MFQVLAKLVPLRDWLYAALAVAGIAFWFYHDHVEQAKGAAHELAAVQKASEKAADAAAKRNKAIDDRHAADVAQIEDKYEQMLKDADTQHASDLQRLRDADAYRKAHRKAHPMLDGSAVPGAQADGGPDSVERLGQVSAELADALRQDDAALTKCWADRDSLAGK